MKKIFENICVTFLAAVLCGCRTGSGTRQAGFLKTGAHVMVAFPAENQQISGVDKTYVIGAVEPGRTNVTVNGIAADVISSGAFIAMVGVKPGETNILTVSSGKETLVRKFRVAEKWTPGKALPQGKDAAGTGKDVLANWKPDAERADKPWKITGEGIFGNRVRERPDDGADIAHLEKGAIVAGQQTPHKDYVAVWVGSKMGYIARSRIAPAQCAVPSRKIISGRNLLGRRAPRGTPPAGIRIVLDAGHGGHDTGCISPHGWKEKDANLEQALEIEKALKKAGYDVVMTRSDDTFIELFKRPEIACRTNATVFISIHHNSNSENRDPREVRHTTSYASNEKGLQLAACLQKEIATAVKAPDKGAQLKSLAVTRNEYLPSCLLEVDFINCPLGEMETFNRDRQAKVAAAVLRGLDNYFSGNGQKERGAGNGK